MGLVASSFLDRKVLDIPFHDTGVSDVRKMHETFGVIDPSSKSLGSGDSVGVKVTFTGDNKRTLATLIIGKEVEGTNGMHSYVRVPEQNTVYVMEINKDNLSTKFDDWIKKNLLDISSFDLKSIRMQDYSTDVVETEQGLTVAPTFHSYYKVGYNAMGLGDKWQLDILQRADAATGQRVAVTLSPEEMLNEEKLEEMRQAFDDLKIIDVLRKPETIASAQRAGEHFIKTLDDIEILQNVGYMMHARETADGGTAFQLYSRQGGVSIEMNDGIVYNLMFGNLTGTSIAENANASTSGTVGENAAETTAGDSTNTGTSAATNVLSANRYLMIMAEFDESLVKKDALLPLSEIPTEGEEAEIARIKQDRESAERENQRREAEFNSTIEVGKSRAKELNARFADWFFVISDDVFKKIHLTDNELVTQPGTTLRDAALDRTIAPFGDGAELPAGEVFDTSILNIDLPELTEKTAEENQPATEDAAEPQQTPAEESPQDEPATDENQ